jgi:hypothetical protein
MVFAPVWQPAPVALCYLHAAQRDAQSFQRKQKNFKRF